LARTNTLKDDQEKILHWNYDRIFLTHNYITSLWDYNYKKYTEWKIVLISFKLTLIILTYNNPKTAIFRFKVDTGRISTGLLILACSDQNPLVIYSAHQKSGDNLSFSHYFQLQHHVLSNLITPMHVQTIKFNWMFHGHK